MTEKAHLIPGRIAVATVLLTIVLAAMAAGPVSAQLPPRPEVVLGEGQRALALTTAGDGDLWFGGYQGGALRSDKVGPEGGLVGRIGPDHKATVFGTGMGGDLTAIAVGGDGALWLTDPTDDGIVRSSTAGEVSFFPLPNPDSRPTSIVAGPEGSLWFTEAGRDAIGRITTAGAIDEFALPAGSKPKRIVAGDEDDFWVAANGTSTIYRMTTAGFLTAFPIGGGPENKLHDLTIGPDGKVWFTQSSLSIGRLDQSGKVTEFPLPTPARSAKLIVAGRGNELWFTTGLPDKEAGPLEKGRYADNGLASITTAGHPTYPSCVYICSVPPAAIYVDPSGALRYGLGNFVVLGGGGSAQAATFASGEIGTYQPQRAAIRVMVEHATADGGFVKLPVQCRLGLAAERCRGRLTLSTAPPGKARRLTVGAGTYDLLAGETANVHVRLGTRPRQLLVGRGKLVTKVGASGPIVDKKRHGLEIFAGRG